MKSFVDSCYADYGLLENRAVEESPTSPSLENSPVGPRGSDFSNIKSVDYFSNVFEGIIQC